MNTVSCLQTMHKKTLAYNLDSDGSQDSLSNGHPTSFFLLPLLHNLPCFLRVPPILMLHQQMLHSPFSPLGGVLLITKALNLICVAKDTHYMKVIGLPYGVDDCDPTPSLVQFGFYCDWKDQQGRVLCQTREHNFFTQLFKYWTLINTYWINKNNIYC